MIRKNSGWSAIAIAVAATLPAGRSALAQEVLTVYGTRIEETIPQDLARYGNRVEIITGEQIEAHGFNDVAQALQMLVPGLHVRPKNGAFDYVDASLQGSRTSEILWLVDGVRINNRLYNGTTPLDTVPAHMIERVEVLKGGQGIFYGTQSVGGVVNIVTKTFTDSPDGEVSAGVNSNEGYLLNGYYRTGNDTHQFVGYFSKDEADGYQPWRDQDVQPSATDRERGYDVGTIGLKYGYNATERSRISVQYQHTDADLDFARPYLNYSTINSRDEDILTLKYDWQASDNVGLFVKAYRHDWDTHYTRIYNTLDGSGNVTGALQVIDDNLFWGYDDYGFNAMAKIDAGGPLEYVVGVDHQSFSGADEVWRIADLEEDVNALFAQIRTTPMLMDHTTLAVGFRQNEPSNAESGSVWNISGKHDFSERFYIRGNVGTSFRLPDAEELFLNEIYDANSDGIPDGGYFAVGNPSLKPERSENINIGVGGVAGKLSWELIRYDRTISDYIYAYFPTVIAGVDGETFINTSDEVNVGGFEFIGAIPFSDSWSANFSVSSSDSELNSDGIQLRGIPESEIKLGLGYQPSSSPIALNVALDHVGDINARPGQIRGDYTVLDLALGVTLGANDEHRLSFRIENATDEVYASRVDTGTLDATQTSYLYDALGMKRTLHASYTRRF